MLVLQSLLLSISVEVFGYFKAIFQLFLKTDDQNEVNLIKLTTQDTCVCTLDEFGLKFIPPVYVQRYMAVQEILEHSVWNNSIKKVIDFGCSEFGLFRYLKPIPGLESIMLVDVDEQTLEMNQSRVLPINYDHYASYTRKVPLTVDIYQGSVADLDDRMLGADAVICIELIEHLYSDVLDAVPYTVFEFIKPKLAVFTTPNVEFNVFFPNFTTEFRHYDHKFEWNRRQFKEWIQNITLRYPEYSYQIEGIGPAPLSTGDIGCCTQMVIFYRKDMQKADTSPLEDTSCGENTHKFLTSKKPYKLLRRVHYPYDEQNENIQKEQFVFEELRKFISEATSNSDFRVGDTIEIPLDRIMPVVSTYCSSTDELNDIISKYYETKKNDCNVWILTKCVSTESDNYNNSDLDEDIYQSRNNPFGDDISPNENDAEHQWNPSEDNMVFNESKLCYSTPMSKKTRSEVNWNNVDSFSTDFSNTDMYKTAIDDKNEQMDNDMELSLSCNNSFVVDDSSLSQDFMTCENSSISNEDTLIIDFNEDGKTDISLASCNGNTIVDDCSVYGDFARGRKNSKIDEEDLTNLNNNTNDDKDMDISSSCNNSLIIDDCAVYHDFMVNRDTFSKINEEDTCAMNDTGKYCEKELSNDCSNSDLSHDTVIEINRNLSCKDIENSNDAEQFICTDNQNEHFYGRKILDSEKINSQPDMMSVKKTKAKTNSYDKGLPLSTGKVTEL